MQIEQTEKLQLKLVEKVQNENCAKSMRELLFQYEPLFYSMRNSLRFKFKQTPLEGDDILNQIKYNFMNLVNKYDIEKGMAFPNYIKIYLQYNVISYIRKFTSQNNRVLNYVGELIEDVNVSADIYNEDEEELNEIINKANLNEEESLIVNEYILGNKPMQEIIFELKVNQRAFHYIKRKALNKIAKSNISKL